MDQGVKKYRVNCPFSNQPEYVYVYYINDTAAFNGCDNNYHGCAECNEACRLKALELFGQESREAQPLHGRMP